MSNCEHRNRDTRAAFPLYRGGPRAVWSLVSDFGIRNSNLLRKRPAPMPVWFGLFPLLFACLCFGGITKRERGENLYYTIAANTMGKGNLWVSAQMMGFIWDNALTAKEGGGQLKIFPSLEARYGILQFLQSRVYSRVLSYGFSPGFVGGELKATLPNNMGIRFLGLGLALQYERGLLDKFSSIGGDRVGGTGFSPEGLIYEAGSMNFILATDLDFIALSSYTPFTVYLNAGYSLPNDAQYRTLSQVLLRGGIEYKGVGVDFFSEFSMNALNNFTEPLLVDILPPGRIFAVHFAENLWFITTGARMRYEGGLTLGASVSFRPKPLVSDPGATLEDKIASVIAEKEQNTAVRDGFSPFYADWTLQGVISYPLRYAQPSSEIYRGFLLKKNEKRKRVIDIDEKVKTSGQNSAEEEQEAKKRLEQIEERKKKVMDEIILD